MRNMEEQEVALLPHTHTRPSATMKITTRATMKITIRHENYYTGHGQLRFGHLVEEQEVALLVAGV